MGCEYDTSFRRLHRRGAIRWFRGRRVAGLAVLAIGSVVVAKNPTPDPDPQRFAKGIAAFERWDRKNAWPADPILFVGSSSIRMWPTRESFPRLPVLNRGFGGAHISDVNHYFDRVVAPYSPRAIVFYCGDNDIAAGKTPERVLADFRRFVDLVRARLPEYGDSVYPHQAEHEPVEALAADAHRQRADRRIRRDRRSTNRGGYRHAHAERASGPTGCRSVPG
jgi:hypothetical protein